MEKSFDRPCKEAVVVFKGWCGTSADHHMSVPGIKIHQSIMLKDLCSIEPEGNITPTRQNGLTLKSSSGNTVMCPVMTGEGTILNIS